MKNIEIITTNSQIKLKTSSLRRSSLCVYSDAYMLVEL